jgi:hypothetical protein
MPRGSPAQPIQAQQQGQVDPDCGQQRQVNQQRDRQPQQASPQLAQRRRAPYGRHRKHQRERQRPPGSGHAANHQRGGLRGPEPAMGDRHADPAQLERWSVRITSQAELVMRRGDAEGRRAARQRSAPPLRLAYRQSRTGPR